MNKITIWKRMALLGAVCGLAVLLLTAGGCSKQSKNETLLIAGSSTMHPYIDKLKEEFVKKNPHFLIESDGGGSTAGLIAVKRNAIDLATASRDVRADEDDRYTRDYLVAKDAIGIVVHPTNPVTNITKDQLRDIFTGVITNWRQLGGNDAPIILTGRKKGSTTRKGMDEMVIGGLDFGKNSKDLDSAAAVTELVAKTPDAVGYLALKDITPAVRPLQINRIAITREAILTGRYPISRSFYLVIYDNPKSAVQKFIDFTLSKEGQAILEHEGLIRIN